MEIQEQKKQIALEIKLAIIELNKKIKEANRLRIRVNVMQLPSRNAIDDSDVSISIYETTSY